MSHKDLMSKLLMGTVAYGAIAAVALPATAQDAAAETDNTFEEIYVTARKKQELITEVPMNIATVSSVEIGKRNLVNKEEFFRSIAGASAPGVGGFNNRGQLILRGLSGGNDATPDTSSTFTDGIPLNFSDLYDVERVEVLRGPQGTLYGSNAIGGTVRVITKQPNLDEMEIGGSVLFKNEANRPGNEVRGYGMINMPIVEGKMALRVTGSSGSQEGKIVNVYNHHNGSVDERFLRAQLLWSPEEDTRVNFKFVHKNYHNTGYTEVDVSKPGSSYEAILTPNADAPYGYDVAFDFPDCPTGSSRPQCKSDGSLGDVNPDFAVWNLMDSEDYQQLNVFGLNIEKDNIIDGVDLIYAGSYQDESDGGRQGGWSRNDAQDMFRTWIIDKDSYTRWTHEFRLQSSGDQALEWTVGAFYDKLSYDPRDDIQWQYHATDNKSRAIASYLWGNYWGYGDPSQIGLDLYGDDTANYNARRNQNDSRELAFFGEAGYTFDMGDSGKLEVTAGLRYYDLHDTIDSQETGIWVNPDGTPNVTLTDDGESGTRKKFSVNYMPNDSFAVYAIYSEGYRPGGNNGSSAPHACNEDENIGSYVDRYSSDQIKNYELGVKGFAFDRKVQFSAAAYQIDWTGVQASVYMPSCGFSYTANAASAKSRGVEFESTTLLTDSLKLILNAAHTNSKMTSDVPSLGAKDGDSMTMVPKYNFYVALDQEFELWGREASARLDVNGYGEYKSNFNTLDQDISPAYQLVNLSAGMQVTENARIGVHVNNLLNERTLSYRKSRSRSGRSQLNEYYNPDRTVSVRLDFSF